MRSILPPAAALALALAGCASVQAVAPNPAPAPAEGYTVYVASEAVDQVSRVRFQDGVITVERKQTVGIAPTEIDGPHGLAVTPDGESYLVSIAHGTPNGTLWKFSAETGRAIANVPLGLFPATVDVTPDGQFAFVSNFNLHGDHVPSSVSKVHLGTMAEVARAETCIMPHGSRVNPQGTKHYSACMMDQTLVEIDVATGAVSRRLSVVPGMEGAEHAGMDHSAHAPAAGAKVCSPTWAQPSADGSKVYVACNKSAEILEIDVATWRIERRFATGEAPYNLAVTPDGRYLLATLKNRAAPATEVIDLSTGRTAARVPASTVLPHGVVISRDGRYAFVSVEGVGSEPGKVDVIDLVTLQRVASASVGQQAGGIAVRD